MVFYWEESFIGVGVGRRIDVGGVSKLGEERFRIILDCPLYQFGFYDVTAFRCLGVAESPIWF